MNQDLSGDIVALLTAVQALTRGLLIQQETLRTMDEKLTELLRAATNDDEGNELQQLLARIVKGIESLADGQSEIVNLLRVSAH
jgi:hypothetical protein